MTFVGSMSVHTASVAVACVVSLAFVDVDTFESVSFESSFAGAVKGAVGVSTVALDATGVSLTFIDIKTVKSVAEVSGVAVACETALVVATLGI